MSAPQTPRGAVSPASGAGTPASSPPPTPRGLTTPARRVTRDGDVQEAKFGTGSTAAGIGRRPRPQEPWGNIVGAVCTLGIPLAVTYAYGVNVMHPGRLVIPGYQFWVDLVWRMPEGVAFRPTVQGIAMVVAWVIFQAFLQLFVPGRTSSGAALSTGARLPYKLNGLSCFVITLSVVVGACILGLLDPTLLYRNFGACYASAVFLSYAFGAYLYVHYGVFWKRWQGCAEFEADWGVLSFKEFFGDFWMGTARNPRVLHVLPVPLDLQFFFSTRVGLTLWVICNFSIAAAQYTNCSAALDAAAVQCEAGDFSRVSFGMLSICLMQFYYALHYFLREEVAHRRAGSCRETFGFMRAYQDLGCMPWWYSQFAWFLLASQGYPVNFAAGNLVTVGNLIAVSGFVCAMSILGAANQIKSNFTAAAEAGNLQGYKVWGKEVDYIKTKAGSYFLCSGFWGKARQVDFIADLLIW
eukprot:CAMPEP_0204375092 /NCGR_PEP_ID=MMETSP0469-20131031/49007_1 /ASSEMBLY_ACC=CAM_ASM_000384 /TAXON_ID=2969 /ORGANISM="Oxyrrhis marina" /LENGTH=466 /DNA_ID=CAMNT_0051365729 /DNA_START=9 /DNA_END=1406 /DNA_ORIENTATION=-